MRIRDLTVPELEHYRKMCNFLDDELVYFNMKSRGKSNVQISNKLNISEVQVSRIATKVREKMLKVGQLSEQ